jgi:hypothetical protein
MHLTTSAIRYSRLDDRIADIDLRLCPQALPEQNDDHANDSQTYDPGKDRRDVGLSEEG